MILNVKDIEDIIIPWYMVQEYIYEIEKIEKRRREMNIVDVSIIVPNKVVEVTFADGTKEKSVCREPDVFSLETGISAYNNMVKSGVKVYKEKLKREAAVKAEQDLIEKKRAKRLACKERRLTKRAEEERIRREKEREEQIEIQKEAYLRAMDVLRSENRGA